MDIRLELEDKMGIVHNNIKALRKIYGETQKELADAICVTKQCISNYERADRDPAIEDLTAIAKHYHVSLEQLTRKLIEIPKESDEFVMDKEYAQLIFCAEFPLFYSKEADKDPDFHKAFCFSEQIYDKILKSEMPMNTMVNLCWNYYTISWKKSKTIESLANLLSLMFLCCLSQMNKEEINLEIAFHNKKTIDNDFLKKYYLRDINTETENDDKKFFVKEYYEEVMRYITILKKHEKWSDLGDYYLALRYIVGLIDNDRDVDINQSFGDELMDTLFDIENPYAIDYQAATLGYCKPQNSGKRSVYIMD